MHRQTSKSGSNTDNTTFAYSDDGRRVKATSLMATDSIYLNVLGAPEKTWTKMSDGKTYTRNYNYTQAGLLDSVWTNVSHETFLGRKYKYTTSRGTLDEIRVGGKSTSHTFNSNLQPTSTTFAGGDVVTRQYTTPHSTAKIESNQAGLDVLVRRLEYDTVGRIKTQYTDPIPVEFGTVFGYDGLNRVVRDTMGMIESDLCTFDPDDGYDCPPPTTDSVRSFIYDAVGNMTRDSLRRVFNGGTDVATGAYGTANRITSFDGCNYLTDADGNVTQRSGCGSTVTFYWSSENRLDSMLVGAQKIRSYYDAFGRLVKRDVYGTISYYWWDGDNLFAELDGAGRKKAEYSYYPGLDNLHALVDQDDSVFFAHSDGFGNVIGLVSETKVLRRKYEYDLKGNLVGGWDTKPFSDRDRARFKGALWMGPEVDMYYMRNRWYETHSGRFLSEDPIGLDGGINQYVYSKNNPVSLKDPAGLKICFAKFDSGDRERLVDSLEHALDAIIEIGDDGCLKKIISLADPGTRRGRIARLLVAALNAQIEFGRKIIIEGALGEGSNFSRLSLNVLLWKMKLKKWRVNIDRGQIGLRYATDDAIRGCGRYGATWSAGSIFIHETVGHGRDIPFGGGILGQREAILTENLYHFLEGGPSRSIRCGL